MHGFTQCQIKQVIDVQQYSKNNYVCILLEQLKSPLFNLFKKLPIIQKIIREYLAQA
jgi:hypothetical protein